MLPATAPGAASQVAPAEAARIAAVLRAALCRATIKANALRLESYTAWARATYRPWNHALTLLAFLSRPACQHSDAWRQLLIPALRYACHKAGTADFAQDTAIPQGPAAGAPPIARAGHRAHL